MCSSFLVFACVSMFSSFLVFACVSMFSSSMPFSCQQECCWRSVFEFLGPHCLRPTCPAPSLFSSSCSHSFRYYHGGSSCDDGGRREEEEEED
ncbi:hypothetical protein Pmani_027877 [Petrolisthes manimaculis]|uniref:Secreted protein n=1 Tax=Petrolisthes manimaculis TaxID=1843537 RepID=A0AAE1P371_9EUCA|nr:hypothetical protein Pmani_027877 [Petrolisthes manimaculis]